MFGNILVCLDGSKLAEQILPFAEAQAIQFRSRILLCQVVTYSNTNDSKVQKEQDQANIDQANKYLESISRLVQAKGIPADSVVVNEAPIGKAILDCAEDNAIDLIAIATRGQGRLQHLIYGSVAEYLLRESGLPMLVIKPNDI